MIQRNILVATKPGLRPFALKNVSFTIDPHFRETKTDFNLYWHTSDTNWAEAHLAAARAEAVEQKSLVGDPLFRDPGKGDFRFKAGSPAKKLGIEPIDLRKVGLRE
jgi:hypothetical protein